MKLMNEFEDEDNIIASEEGITEVERKIILHEKV